MEETEKMEEIVKRDAKNTVFIDLFSQNEYRLQLFQTLHPEITDVTADELQIITIKPIITNQQYNDLACRVDGGLAPSHPSQIRTGPIWAYGSSKSLYL